MEADFSKREEAAELKVGVVGVAGPHWLTGRAEEGGGGDLSPL